MFVHRVLETPAASAKAAHEETLSLLFVRFVLSVVPSSRTGSRHQCSARKTPVANAKAADEEDLVDTLSWDGTFIDTKDEHVGATWSRRGDHPFTQTKTHLAWLEVGDHHD